SDQLMIVFMFDFLIIRSVLQIKKSLLNFFSFEVISIVDYCFLEFSKNLFTWSPRIHQGNVLSFIGEN
ncbi:MAG: hypothetical protein N2578_06485, partial [Bdellovibrionaceae bacterium]|nr:hypothetical protein [Pseudobdellovibrionaceae bacterium]